MTDGGTLIEVLVDVITSTLKCSLEAALAFVGKRLATMPRSCRCSKQSLEVDEAMACLGRYEQQELTERDNEAINGHIANITNDAIRVGDP